VLPAQFRYPERPLRYACQPGRGASCASSCSRWLNPCDGNPAAAGRAGFQTESAHIEKAYKDEEAKAYAELSAFAEARNFSIHREDGRMVFTLLGEAGQPLVEDEVLSLPKDRRVAVDRPSRNCVL